MKISKKEQNLLMVLGIVILVYLFFTFIYTPQALKLEQTKAELENQKATMERIELAMQSEGQIDMEILNIKQELFPIVRSYFGDLNQEESIVILNDFGISSSMQLSKISFTEPMPNDLVFNSELEKEQVPVEGTKTSNEQDSAAGDTSTQENSNNSLSGNITYMSANVGFEGTYEQLMAFLNQMGIYHKNIVSTTMNIEQTDNSLLEGEVLLDFYSVKNVDKYIEKSDSVLAANAVPKTARNNIFANYAWTYNVTDIPAQYASNTTPIGYEGYQ